jgi:hypothetical protein
VRFILLVRDQQFFQAAAGWNEQVEEDLGN